jgi:arylsulfatase
LELAGGQWPKQWEGQPIPPPPGHSLAPTFTTDHSVTHDDLWWFHSGNRAIRVGTWKLVSEVDGPWELYDLSVDRAEMQDVSEKRPEIAARLEKIWQARLDEFTKLATDTP